MALQSTTSKSIDSSHSQDPKGEVTIEQNDLRVSTIASESTEEKTLPLLQAFRKWPWITAYSFALSSSSLLYGYDMVIVGTVSSMPAFQVVYGTYYGDQWIISASWLAIWHAASPIGQMLGAIAGGWIMDRFGRRFTLAIMSLISAAAVAVCYVSDLPAAVDSKRGLFFVGKFLQGFSLGALMTATQTYLSEIVPHQMRHGIMAFCFPLSKLGGQLIGSAVVRVKVEDVAKEAYRVCFVSQWPFSFVPLVLAFFLPESPTWLLRKHRLDAARRSHQRLEGSKSNDGEEANFARLCKAIQHEHEESGMAKASYLQCLQGANLRRTLLVAYCNALPYLFGFSMLGSASYFMQTIGMEPSASINTLMVGIALGLISNLCTFYTLSKFGRRPLALATLTMTVLLWLSMGLSGIWQNNAAMWYTAVALIGVIVTVGVGVWPASFSLGSEASSLRLRAKTQGIGWCVTGLSTLVFGIAAPYIYNPDSGAQGSKTGFVFCGTTAIALVIAWFHWPETKGRDPMEVDRMFELRLSAREFKNWKKDDGEIDGSN